MTNAGTTSQLAFELHLESLGVLFWHRYFAQQSDVVIYLIETMEEANNPQYNIERLLIRSVIYRTAIRIEVNSV